MARPREPSDIERAAFLNVCAANPVKRLSTTSVEMISVARHAVKTLKSEVLPCASHTSVAVTVSESMFESDLVVGKMSAPIPAAAADCDR